MRLVTLLGLIGCSSGTPTPTLVPTDTDVHVDPCPGLGEADCAAEPSCWPVDGYRCGGDPEQRVYVGCVDAESDCADIGWTCAQVETPDACVSMASSCDFIVDGVERGCPEGWVDCATTPDCPAE